MPAAPAVCNACPAMEAPCDSIISDCICWNAVPTPTSPPSSCATPAGAFITASRAPIKKMHLAIAPTGTSEALIITIITRTIWKKFVRKSASTNLLQMEKVLSSGLIRPDKAKGAMTIFKSRPIIRCAIWIPIKTNTRQAMIEVNVRKTISELLENWI